jgi:hypothetical protein
MSQSTIRQYVGLDVSLIRSRVPPASSISITPTGAGSGSRHHSVHCSKLPNGSPGSAGLSRPHCRGATGSPECEARPCGGSRSSGARNALDVSLAPLPLGLWMRLTALPRG